MREAYSQGFNIIFEEDSLSKCWKLFKKLKPPVLAVYNEKGKYTGVITRRWIIRSRMDHSSTKVKTLMKSAPKIQVNNYLTKAAKLMIESGIRQLPVFDKKTLIGFITDENIIQGAILTEWGNNKLNKIMTKAPITIEGNRSVGALLNILREQGISHIPIMEMGKLIGIVSIQDIIDNIFQPKQRQTHGEIVGEKVPVVNIPSRSIMSSPVITVEPEISIKKAIEKMKSHNISSLVVVDGEILIGIVTKLDFLEPIAQMEQEKKLKIQFGIKGFEMNPSQKELIIDEFNSFIHKYEEGLEVGTLFVYLKTLGKSHKGIQLIHCRLQLKTAKGAFYSSGEGYGVESTFQIAMERLDRRLLRSKELSHNPKFARDFLQDMSFSQ